jgi:hypothetical protein
MARARAVLLLAGIACLTAASARAGGAPKQLAVSDLNTGPGHTTKLTAGVTYGATSFPLAFQITPPDASWAGAQWKSARGRKPPFYGWAAVAQDGTKANVPPHGLIMIMTSYSQTPSVTATIAGLRTRGGGATYEASSPVKLAGFSGVQFDGQAKDTQHHTFVPFSPPTHAARAFPDAFEVENGEPFRLIVLNVRGKSVIVMIDGYGVSSDEFPAFLTKAAQILRTLTFPK